MAEKNDIKLTDPRAVASYQSYAAAKSAVAILVGEGMPLEGMAIVGLDLKSPDHGGLTWGKVILTGVFSGLMWGLLLSVLLWIFLPGHNLWLLVGCGMGFGVVYGILAQVVQHAMTHPSRFETRGTVVATRFEVQAEPDIVDGAREILGAVTPIKDEPESPRPPRRAIEDASWLAAGASKPVPPEKLPHLADQKTEVMKMSGMGDWFGALDDDDGPRSPFFGDPVNETTSSIKPIRD